LANSTKKKWFYIEICLVIHLMEHLNTPLLESAPVHYDACQLRSHKSCKPVGWCVCRVFECDHWCIEVFVNATDESKFFYAIFYVVYILRLAAHVPQPMTSAMARTHPEANGLFLF